MKQLIVALIGETGSGKSTFCSMCTSENIHPIIAGAYGQKGTTKSTKRMIFSKSIENFNINEFNLAYSEGKTEFGIPLSTDINLSPFEALTILDTQGLNDWKSEKEKEKTNNAIFEVCDEADIILITIPEGGNVVTTDTILQEIFTRYCHKPIVFIYRAQQSREKLLKKEKSIPLLKPFVNENADKYRTIYPNLGEIIKNVQLPENAGVSPLFCILPNSEELSSDIEESERQSDNTVLREYISDTLQYAINLQNLLINEMANEYVKNNLSIIANAVQKLLILESTVSNIKQLRGLPLRRPYVKNTNFNENYNVEYSWQGGTPRMYPVCGGDYTYAANDIYVNLSYMIQNLDVPVTVKSSLLSILYSKSEDKLTPGTLNLPYPSYMRGVPIEWIINLRTDLYNKKPELFVDIDEEDHPFDNAKHYESWINTKEEFKNTHEDWNKLLSRFYYYPLEQQELIKNRFGKHQWQATILINQIFNIVHEIDFCQSLNEKIKSDFDDIAFDSQGKCVLWSDSFNT